MEFKSNRFDNIDTTDPMCMNRLGRMYAGLGDDQALTVAAEVLATTSESQRASFSWWWLEGVRDYAKGQDHVEELVSILDQAVVGLDAE